MLSPVVRRVRRLAPKSTQALSWLWFSTKMVVPLPLTRRVTSTFSAAGKGADVFAPETLNAVYRMDVADWMRTMLSQWDR